ncbi:MAG: terminase, partial [Terriglobales bacterium]
LAAVGRALEGAGEALELRDNERLTIWLPTQAGREYVIGADPAGGGTEGDYSCAEVIDRELGTQCAELHGHWPPREFALKLVQLGKEYNTALLAVERNNHGSGVLAHLQTAGYPKVYKQQGQDGWWTSAVSRPRMIENLGDALIEEPGLFRSRLLLNECRTFVRFADGNTGAAAGTHDDCVMAMAIAWAVRKGEAGRTERPVG